MHVFQAVDDLYPCLRTFKFRLSRKTHENTFAVAPYEDHDKKCYFYRRVTFFFRTPPRSNNVVFRVHGYRLSRVRCFTSSVLPGFRHARVFPRFDSRGDAERAINRWTAVGRFPRASQSSYWRRRRDGIIIAIYCNACEEGSRKR